MCTDREMDSGSIHPMEVTRSAAWTGHRHAGQPARHRVLWPADPSGRCLPAPASQAGATPPPRDPDNPRGRLRLGLRPGRIRLRRRNEVPPASAVLVVHMCMAEDTTGSARHRLCDMCRIFPRKRRSSRNACGGSQRVHTRGVVDASDLPTAPPAHHHAPSACGATGWQPGLCENRGSRTAQAESHLQRKPAHHCSAHPRIQ